MHTGILLFFGEQLVDPVTNFTFGNLDIVLGVAIVGHQRKEAIVLDIKLVACQKKKEKKKLYSRGHDIGKTHELVFLAGHVRDVHVVGGRGEILQLLPGEDVDGDQMDLGVTVLSGLRGGHIDDLARAVLDNHEPVLPQSGTLHWEGGRGTSIGAFESELMLQ